MPSPSAAIHISDGVCALLIGHALQLPTSSDASLSCDPCVETYRKESGKSEVGKVIPKHGFVIEPSPFYMDSVSSHGTSMFDSNTSKQVSCNPITGSNSSTENTTKMELEVQPPVMSLLQRRPRSGSEGLDYLAFLAEQERQKLDAPTATTDIRAGNITSGSTVAIRQCQQQCTSEYPQSETYSVVTPPTTVANFPQTSSSSSSSSSSDTEDLEAMPPPQPRRPRSISNPDYMMTMEYQPDSDRSVMLKLPIIKKHQQHFVLPPHLLRDELAKARNAVVRKAAAEISMAPYSYHRYETSTSGRSSFCASPTIPEHAVYLQSTNDQFDYYKYGYAGNEEEGEYDDDEERPESGDEYDDDDMHEDTPEDQDVAGHDDEMDMPVDTSISSTDLLRRARSRLLEDLLSETNTLAGTNDKAITVLPHTLSKYKMIYNQNGRIGIYTPQERAAIIERYHAKRAHRNWNKKIRYNCRKSLADRRLRVKGRFVKRSVEVNPQQEDGTETSAVPEIVNDHMPDVNDPDAGFCPTLEQPYRRSRRHTVT